MRNAYTVLLTACLCFTAIIRLPAQQFWLTTHEFPGGPKTAISLQGDSVVFTSTASGIMRSLNQAYTFDTVLTNPAITALHFSNQYLYAGTQGKIYRTNNLGQSWDSVMLNTNNPITKFIQLPNGHIIAGSGNVDLPGYVGDGIFISSDEGTTWQQRNNGFGSYTACFGLTADKNSRIYAAMADDFSTGDAGLFYSDNEGQQWQHVNIYFDGQNAVNDTLQVTQPTGLAVSPDDSLYFSFEGAAFNTSVRLNLVKHINDIADTSNWQRYQIKNTATWWNDAPLTSVHFAKNGDRYSSYASSMNTGGTFFSKAGTNNWERHAEGLGLDLFSNRGAQQFVETSEGKILMIALLDERIYKTDTSSSTQVGLPIETNPHYTVYPNPVKHLDYFTIQTQSQTPSEVTLYNENGQLLWQTQTIGANTLPAPPTAGIYLLLVKQSGRTSALKLVVY
ncbi:MAG: T9SS type A sorting domain-containing protein [Chitinophagales bacterium]